MIISLIEGYFCCTITFWPRLSNAPSSAPAAGISPGPPGLCRACYRSAAHSREHFAGLRDQILDRDGRQCRACGSADRLHVHHRQPGVNDPDRLITVCAGCHARLHRLAVLRIWIPEPLVALWIEQHPGAPVQLQLPVAA